MSHKQNEYIRNANARWNMKIGAVRSGKSYVDIAYMIAKRLRERHGKPGVNAFLGVSGGTVERNVLTPMREIFTDALVGTINNSTGKVMVCGEEVYVFGAEKINSVAKIQGLSIKYCYGDEIAKWNKEVFAMLESRLDKPYSCFDGACNPEGPNHWLKEWLDKPGLDMYKQKYVIFDNPFLPKSYVEALCNEYRGTVYYNRYILGEWALAEGLIYPMYEKAIEDAPNSPAVDYCLSLDYGTQNAFAAILWERHEMTWYAVREYYYSGRDTGVQKTDEEYADDMDDFIRDIMEPRQKEAERMYEPYRKMEVIVDPSAASFIALIRKRPWYKVKKGNNDVLNGIRDVATALNDGSIKISPKMDNWRKEIQGYVWDEKAKEDKPVKENDHLMDAMRYFVRTKHIVRNSLRKNYADISRFA